MRQLWNVGMLLMSLMIGIVSATAQTGTTGGTIKNEPTEKKDEVSPSLKFPTEIGGKKVEEWAKLMKESPDPSMREQAIRVMSSFGPAGRKAGSANLLWAMTQDRDFSVRVVALGTVPSLGFEEEHQTKGIDAMIEIARVTAQFNTRYEAIMALENCGPLVRKAIPMLLEPGILHNTVSWQIRRAAMYALGRIGMPSKEEEPADAKALAGLVAGLRDPSWEVRRESLNSLMIIGNPGTTEELVTLRKALTVVTTDKTVPLQIWARVCLMRFNENKLASNDPNLIALCKLFKHPELTVRIEALSGLTALLPEEAALKMSDVFDVIQTDVEVVVVIQAISTLTHMNKDWRKIIEFMEGVQKSHPNKTVQEAAKQAVEVLTGAEKAVVNKELNKDKDKEKDKKK